MATPKTPKFGPAMGSPASFTGTPAAPARSVKPSAPALGAAFGAGAGAKIGQKMGAFGQNPAAQAAIGRMQERRATRQATRAAAPPMQRPMPGGPGLRAGNPNYIPPVGMNPQGPMMANGGKAKAKPKSSGRKR